LLHGTPKGIYFASSRRIFPLGLPRRRNFAGFVRQAFASLAHFDGQYPVLGSWLVDHTPCGLSIREDESPITGNNSRFLPHAIL